MKALVQVDGVVMSTYELAHHTLLAVWSEVLGSDEDQVQHLPRKEQIEIERALGDFLSLVFDLQAPDLKHGRERRLLRRRWFTGRRR